MDLKKWNLKYLAIVLIVPMLWLGVGSMGYLDYLETITQDWRFKARGPIEAPIKLIYVDLDAEAIEFMGERPIPRAYFAHAIEGLFKYGGAKVVAADILFSGAAHSSLVDERLVQKDLRVFREVVEAYPNLVLGCSYTLVEPEDADDEPDLRIFPYMHLGYTDHDENDVPEMPESALREGVELHMGLMNAADHYSPGPTARWVPLFAETPERDYMALSLEAFRLYHETPSSDMEFGEDAIVLNPPEGEAIEIPLEAGQLLEVNWFSPWISEHNPRFSLKDAIESKLMMDSGDREIRELAEPFYAHFEDALVLIGAVDPLLQNLAPAPFERSEVPRVGIHGNAIKTMAAGEYIEHPSRHFYGGVTYGLTILGTFFCLFFEKRRFIQLARWVGPLSVLGYLVFAFLVFNEWHWAVPIVLPVGAALMTHFIIMMTQLVSTERQKGHLQDLFGTYVSRDLVEQMVEAGEDPKLGGAEQEVTAFFSDIEGFTRISEALAPRELIGMINEYLSEMTEVIQQERGTLDKYIGDAIVAMYGAPLQMEDHALAACRTACLMQKRQRELIDKWGIDGRPWADLVSNMRTRIGISTGDATIGNMGSHVRFNYTMLGDSVNLAARCENANKFYGTRNLVTERTRYAVQEVTDEICFRSLGKIRVQGKTIPVPISEVIGFTEGLSEMERECLGYYGEGMEAYEGRDFEKAARLFEQSGQLEYTLVSNDRLDELTPSGVFLGRSRQYMEETPAEDWDAVFAPSEK